ncbi:MAG: hypothetical protein KAV48_00820 [Methanomicrobia archaeon]|nr:hypothetical protein [Methanomicrobia archaeon]MCK4310730.1 hypothetical protein [Methanomicrobia archaeon]MCK4432452.1 hypothetical protein [Methanomicrobia archaeon]MCK4636354.1 hypothetical protein [Methanomicrobia archaeon]
MDRFFRALMDKDVKKMKEIYEEIKPQIEKGYIKALNGFISVLENNDPRALLYLILDEELKKKEVKDLYRRSEKIYTDEFRKDEERYYEKAWMEFLRYYMNNEKIEGGLDKYMEEG